MKKEGTTTMKQAIKINVVAGALAGWLMLGANSAEAQQPTCTVQVLAGQSIVVVSTATVSVFPGYFGSAAAHNIILNNTVLENQPFDLAYDGEGTGNRFLSNTCDTSYPAGLCP
jgi:hypothetical protein